MSAMGELNMSGGIRPRTAAIVAGIGLLVMAVVAAFSNMGVINRLIVSTDAG